jgi:DNA (cytosine-5)-methyltransferase 1
MTRPRLLDLFCGAGGAAMGYHRAGFDVVGVDIKPQPHYPFEFHQADAMTYPLEGFNVIHASPPCQRYSATMRMTRSADRHPDLLQATINRLRVNGGRWVVENVDGAPFDWAFAMCGWGFGMPFHRHRFFQLDTWSLQLHPACPGNQPEGVSINPYKSKNGRSMRELRDAMGVDWMGTSEASQVIPPAYTEWIGRQLLAAIGVAA